MYKYIYIPRESPPSFGAPRHLPQDKGLCGGVNTAVAKQVRLGITAEEAKGNTSKVRFGRFGQGNGGHVVNDTMWLVYGDIVRYNDK